MTLDVGGTENLNTHSNDLTHLIEFIVALLFIVVCVIYVYIKEIYRLLL